MYQGFYQYLLARGVAVLAPNIRGSSGYGREWQVAIHRDWMGVDLRDFRACAEYLRSLDGIDPKRLGVAGGSYGGFATLMCASRLPEYWAAAVDIVGPSNLVTFAKAVPPTRPVSIPAPRPPSSASWSRRSAPANRSPPSVSTS